MSTRKPTTIHFINDTQFEGSHEGILFEGDYSDREVSEVRSYSEDDGTVIAADVDDFGGQDELDYVAGEAAQVWAEDHVCGS